MITQQHTPTYRISRDASKLQRSVMRELLKQAASPEVMSLAGGLPDSALLPHKEYQDCLDTVIRREKGLALQYRPMYEPLREWIATTMNQRGVNCTPDQVFITNGNQQGLTILSRLFVEAGEPATTEEITFTGVQQVTAGRDATMYTVPTDLESGVDVDALEQVFAEHQPRMTVLIPDFHNPLGVSISAEKRQRIAELAGRYQVPVVEDDPYSALRFAGETIPPISAYDDSGFVFYLGSFSKMLAPGLRLGWMITPPELSARLITLRESIDLESSGLTQRAVYEFLARGLLDDHLQRLNAENKTRRDALLDALETHFAYRAHWTVPQGGLFVWLTLADESLNTWDMLTDVINTQQVAYVPGSAFAVDNRQAYQHTMRLNFSNVQPHVIQEAVKRLAAYIKR